MLRSDNSSRRRNTGYLRDFEENIFKVKYIFILNPIAGNDDKAKILSRIKSAFRGGENEMIIEETQARGDAKIISAKYAKEYGSDDFVDAAENFMRRYV